jgi:hypothetical protein
MAISYKDYIKKYNNEIKNAQNYYIQKQESDRINNMTSKEAKAEYKAKTYEKKEAIKDFQNIYKDNGIVVDNNSLNPSANATSYQRENLGKIDYSKKISLNPLEETIETQKKSLENYDMFKKFNEENKDLVNAKKQNVIKKYNEAAQAYNTYQQKKLDEDDIGIYDKTIGRVVGGMTSPFSQFLGEQAVNENGDLYYLPSYNDLKQQKVLDSYGNSFLGKVAKVGTSALYEGGKIATSAVLNKLLPGVGTVTYFSDIYTKQLNQAVSEGYSEGRALSYATLSTATEMITSKVLGGTTKYIFGKGTSSELSKNISTALSKTFTKHPRLVNAVANGISEGGEEFIQEYIDVFARNLTLGEKENPFSMETFENAIYSGAVGALTGSFSGVTDGTDYYKVKTQRQQNIDNTIKLPTSNDLGENIIKPATNTKMDLEKGILPPVNYKTGTDIDTKLNRTKEDVNTTINNRINLPINEMTNTQNGNYQYTKSDNAKINNLRESASKYFNNSQETQNLVSVAEKLVNDKGYNITFDNNMLDKSGNIADGVIEKVNGEISIRLNPNSERAGEFLLIHEMTHAIETPEIRNFIQNFAQKNPEYSEAIKGLETLYESTEITGEAVADISANLFGNQEFINSLAMDNSAQAKTIIQKIYEAIKSFLNSFTKEGREKNFVSKLEKMWREAYITQTNNIVAPIYAKNINNNIASTRGIDYNNVSYEIVPYISADERKTKFTKYSNAESFFELDYERMDKAIAIGSKYVLEAQQQGLDSYSFNDEKYVYYFDIIDKKNNAFSITNVYEIGDEYNDIAIETKARRNSENSLDDSKYYTRNSISNNSTIEEGKSSNKDARIPTRKQRQYGINENRQVIENKFENSRRELDNSSFSIDEKIDNAINNIEIRNERDSELNLKFKWIKNDINEYINKFKQQELKVIKENLEFGDISENIYQEEVDKVNDISSIEDLIAYEENNAGVGEASDRAYELQRRYKEYENDSVQNDSKTFGSKVEKGTKNIVKEILKEYPQLNVNIENSSQSNSFYVKFYYNEELVGELRVSDHVRPPKKTSHGYQQHVYDAQYVPEIIGQDDLGRPLEYSEKTALDDLKYTIEENISELGSDKESFSIEKEIDKYLMPEIYERYKNEDKSKITETIEELETLQKTLKPNENNEDWNKNFLINQKIKALNNGFDNVYDNLVNHDRDELLKDYKYVPEKIEEKINKIKSKENNAKMLEEDYKNATPKQQAQFDIIQKTNPAPEGTKYVWIRKPSDIKEFAETIDDGESFVWGDYSKEDAIRDLKKGTVTIYSSYPIKNGVFVSTSYRQALDYAGGNPSQVHSRKAALDSVAWINGDEGQYAKVTKEKYSKYNQTWQEHIDKYYKPTGTRTDMSKIRIPTKQDVNKSANIPTKETINNTKSSMLSTNEQEELNYLKDSPFELTKEETSRMEYLQNKAEGRIKYSELDGKTSYESIKAEYAKYKDISDFDSNLLNKAKSLVEGYRNTDKRTKDQWLFVAKQIGEQFTGNAEALEKYAIQSWFHEKPNNKDNLNRQGAKYVEFQISDWLNSVYEGAGVGTVGKVKEVKAPTKNNNVLIPTKEDVNKTYTKVETTIDTPEKLAEILKEKPKTIEEKDGRLKKLATIKFIDKGYYVDKLARSAKNKELSSKYDYSLLANGIANNIIGNGRVDEKGNKIGKGLYEIFEPIENSGLIDDFSKYIYHKHNVDRMNLTTRYAEENKAVFGDSMTSEMSEGIVKEYETKYPEFEAWAEDIYKYNQANLEMLVKYGVISKESLDYYNKKYPHYVPTIRDNTKVKTQMEIFLGKKAKVNNPIKKAKGGNSDIIPLKDAMALRTMQTVNSALRNNFGLELMNTIEVEATKLKQDVDSTVEEFNFEDLLTEKSKENPATLTVFQDGKKLTFAIPDEIYEALKPSNIHTSKTLNKLNNIRRGLLTEYNPTFMVTNPLKDIQDGSINSKHPTTFAKNLIEATKQIKNKGMYYQLYIANGGSYETYFNYNTGTNIAPSKIDKIVPLKKISEANEVIEMTPRLAEFISSIEAGDSIETAMYNASEITTNFKRGGDITKTLDRNGVTFLNAGVQGATKQIRNIQEARTEGIKGMSKLAVRWSLAGLAPSLLMGMIWDDDEDYEEQMDYLKNNYYAIVKYGDGQFIRIPKGRVVSVLQKFFQNIIDKADGKEMDIDGFIDLLENNLLPSDPNESSLIAPLKQAMKNETWYGGELVPTRLQNLPDAEQYDESTDSISIWLGKKLNISPYKINYVLDQYAGAIGDYTLPYLTQQAESGSDSFAGKLVAPIKDKFTSDSTLKNQNVTDFYSLSEELTKKSNSSNATDEDKLKNKYINSIKSEMSELYAEKREIQSSDKKDSVKYNESREIQNKINELAKKGLKNYESVKVEDSYATIGDKEYYLNNNSEWTKVDTTTTKYKTAKLLTGYKNYLTYNNEISNVKKQYSDATSRKNAVIKYVNSLKLSIPQKAILIKMNYSSYDTYNSQIIKYIKDEVNSTEERKEILEDLGFTIKDGRVYWK